MRNKHHIHLETNVKFGMSLYYPEVAYLLTQGWYMPYIQWNLRIKDTLGADLLSSSRRLSFGGRFKPICNL